MDVTKIALFGIITVILCSLLKEYKPEYAMLTGMVAGVFLFFCMTKKLEIAFSYIQKLEEYLNLGSEYPKTILKMIGITYIAEFSSGICKETGYSYLAGQIELFAKLSICLLSMPVMLSFMETLAGVMF